MPSTPSPTFLQVTIIPVIATVLGSFLFLLVLVVSVWARRAKKRRAGDKFSARQAPSTELQQLSLRNVDSAARKELVREGLLRLDTPGNLERKHVPVVGGKDSEKFLGKLQQLLKHQHVMAILTHERIRGLRQRQKRTPIREG
ncbi:unnamed protein product [Lampetra fluviatilis]